MKTSGGTYVCCSEEPAVSLVYALSNMPIESSHSTVLVRDTTTRYHPPSVARRPQGSKNTDGAEPAHYVVRKSE